MAYKKKEIFEKAKEVIPQYKLFFIEDIVSFLPCDKTTFYRFFPPECNEYNELKELLEKNRVELKVSMRSKWYTSNAPVLQMALMKLIATPEELQKLSQTYIDHSNKGGKFNDGKLIIAGKKFASQHENRQTDESPN
ncbi:hypothetical protein [Chryseobacterium potabilaquae]|uniref:Uncharacterized protein n=1 Tax=Chryseobacterium potabilaquae TaxID=2675057 RepID=A0A6N4X7V9_9FLAO|nr:hypothetical protein [Chryseobacterium potabilaquae]CAA7196826.1 hypothetical protein CHRY9293_02893 [Chryseobacterium potabilaquae]